MPSFNGQSFQNDITGNQGFMSTWQQEVTIARRLVPYGNFEDLQEVGRGNHRLTIKAWVTSDAAAAALQSSKGATRRTLFDPLGTGVDYTNTMLVSVTDVRRRSYAQEWELTLVFERIGS